MKRLLLLVLYVSLTRSLPNPEPAHFLIETEDDDGSGLDYENYGRKLEITNYSNSNSTADEDDFRIVGGKAPSGSDYDYGRDLVATQDKTKASLDGGGKCKGIDGPGSDKPCIFPFKFRGKTYEKCTMDGGPEVLAPWCSTKVDKDGQHTSASWASCSTDCDGVDEEGYVKTECPAKDGKKKCTLPFLHEGMQYNGCIKTKEGEEPWCMIKKNKTKCSEECREDTYLSDKNMSPDEIKTALSTSPFVYARIEYTETCDHLHKDIDLKQVCSDASYCKKSEDKEKEGVKTCGSFRVTKRFNTARLEKNQKADCEIVCGHPGYGGKKA